MEVFVIIYKTDPRGLLAIKLNKTKKGFHSALTEFQRRGFIIESASVAEVDE